MARLSVVRYLQSRHVWTVLGLASPFYFISAVFIVGAYFTASNFFTDPLTMMAGQASNQAGSQFALRVFHTAFLGAYLHFGIIFAAILFGNSALREETDDHTLHYLYLQPVPRWVIIMGKYAGFIALAAPIFLVSMVVNQLLLLLPYGAQGLANRLGTWDFWGGFLAQTGVMLLAVLLYSALFLALSCIFKNLVYALFIYGWEAATRFLPDVLKDFSLAYYFKEMLPDRPAAAAVELVVAGPGALQTILVLGGVWAACLAFTCWFAGRKECLYGG